VRRLATELADYLLFAGEAPAPVPLTPRPGFAARLERITPKDRQGRSFGQLLLTTRLFRYPCSYMVYSEAFDGLPAAVKTAIYSRMIDTLSSDTASSRLAGERRRPPRDPRNPAGYQSRLPSALERVRQALSPFGLPRRTQDTKYTYFFLRDFVISWLHRRRIRPRSRHRSSGTTRNVCD
jgi:hypothetical protein